MEKEYKLPELENMKVLFDDLYEEWKKLKEKLTDKKEA